MKNRTMAMALVLALLVGSSASGQEEETPPGEDVRGRFDVFVPGLAENSINGVDPTDIRGRLDLGVEYFQFLDGDVFFVPKFGAKLGIKRWGTIGVQVPLVVSNARFLVDPQTNVGIGDTRLNLLVVLLKPKTAHSLRGIAVGVDYVIPTGDWLERTGLGYQALEFSIAPVWSAQPGLLFAPIVQYATSLSAEVEELPELNELFLRTFASYAFPEGIWLTFDPRFIWDLSGRQDFAWTLQGEIGFMLTPTTGLAIDVENLMGGQNRQFDRSISTSLRFLR